MSQPAQPTAHASVRHFPLNAWYASAWDYEVGRNLLPKTIAGRPIVFYRTASGRAVALADACWHRLAPLSMGKLRGDDEIMCGYHGICYDLDALAAHHAQYRRVMAHWHAAMPGQVLDVAYADLVHEPEATLRRVLAFCGLEWEPGCVDLRRNTRAVATLSAAQVRGGIHTSAFGEWRPYARQLAGLRQALGA